MINPKRTKVQTLKGVLSIEIDKQHVGSDETCEVEDNPNK